MTRKPQIEVIDNHEQPLGDLLKRELSSAKEFRAASAFLNSSGLEKLLPYFERILKKGGHVSIVHGADSQITDPDAVSTLVNLRMCYEEDMSYAVYCDKSLLFGHAFHPKLYITSSDSRGDCAIVGSSNLTYGGLHKNIEVNTVMRLKPEVEKCRRVFESILSNRKLLEPNQKFVDVYRQLHELSPSKVQSAQFSELWEDLILGCRPMYEFVAKAIASLQERTESVDLRDIYKEVERLRKEFGIGSRDTSFQPNVRSSLSAHTKGRGARDLFYHNIRSSRRSGKWRLSKEGRDLVRGLTE